MIRFFLRTNKRTQVFHEVLVYLKISYKNSNATAAAQWIETDRRSEIHCNAGCSWRPCFRNTLLYFEGTLHDLAVVSNTLSLGQVSAIHRNTVGCSPRVSGILCNYAVMLPNFSCSKLAKLCNTNILQCFSIVHRG